MSLTKSQVESIVRNTITEYVSENESICDE